MKTSCMTIALLSAAATLSTTTTDAANCDFGAIQSKLFANATEGLKKCAAESGVDIWAISEFPTEKQAQAVMTSRTCVDYLNQINERANQQIQCDLVIQDTTKGFGAFITDLLTGQTGNQTESDSGSNDIEIPDENNAKVKAPLLDGSSSSSIAKSTTTATPKPTTATPTTTKSAATSASLSVVTAGVIAVVGFALQW